VVGDVRMPFLQLLAMIGEQFDDGEEVCGVVLQIRSKEDRIAIWTKTANNETAQVSLLFKTSCLFMVCICLTRQLVADEIGCFKVKCVSSVSVLRGSLFVLVP
jgi:hypothetical protein